jgi:hypothetical protein
MLGFRNLLLKRHFTSVRRQVMQVRPQRILGKHLLPDPFGPHTQAAAVEVQDADLGPRRLMNANRFPESGS